VTVIAIIMWLFIQAPRDFHLRANSPAIGAGVCLAQVRTDFDGKPRPDVGQKCDIGAFQYSADAPPPPTLLAPTNLVSTCGTNTVTLTWNPVVGATSYYFGLDYMPNNGNPAIQDGWFLPNSRDVYRPSMTATTYTGPNVPGQPYGWWVGGNAVGIVGPWTGVYFTCGTRDTTPPTVMVGPIQE
jgi:hypothetical protein